MHDDRWWGWLVLIVIFVIIRAIRAVFRTTQKKADDGIARMNAAAERILKDRAGQQAAAGNPIPRTALDSRKPAAPAKPRPGHVVPKVKSAPAVIRRDAFLSGGREPVVQRRRERPRRPRATLPPRGETKKRGDDMIRATGMLALAAAVLLIAACAAKKMEPEPAAPTAETAPAAAFDPALLPSAGAKPILLSSETMPDGAELEQGTLVTGRNGWAVHGENEGVAWRYGSSDAGFLRVAGEPNTEWQHIQVAQSWAVQCKVEPGTDGAVGRTPCLILRLAPIEPGTMATGGLALDEHVTCVRAENASEPATISVDGAAPVSLPQPSLCLSGADSDALQKAMIAGQSITIQAGFQPKGAAKSMQLPTHGLKQALAMRGSIVEQYKAGKLTAVD
jgi:hypothetical protein